MTEVSAVNSTVQDIRVSSSNQNVIINCETSHDRVAVNSPLQYSSVPPVDNNEKSNSNDVSRTKGIEEKQTVKKIKAEVKAEDDEEIDVEHVDKADPMWRPW